MQEPLRLPDTDGGDRLTLLAIDDVSLPMRTGVCLYLTRPDVWPDPVLAPSPRESDAPDNAATHFYGTVLHDGGRFRMWYYACHWGKNPDWPPRMMQQIAKKPAWLESDAGIYQGPLCYAESDDGIAWTKPALGQVAFRGTKAHNALALPHTIVSGATVIRDDADPDPERRYKMVYQFFPDQTEPPIDELGTAPTIATAISSDGLCWEVTGIPYRNEFDEHSSFYKFDGAYIVNYQTMASISHCSEGGHDCGRTGMVKLSPDFDTWVDGSAVSFGLPEPPDPADRGMLPEYDQVHLGGGAAAVGNVCVGLFGRWHNSHFQETFSEISCDLGLVVSNDGIHFREPAQGYNFISRHDSPATPLAAKVYNTNLCQGNGILNVGDETRIYHGRWRNVGSKPDDIGDYYAEVALATIGRDRWGALGLMPNAEAGVVWSAPIRIPEGGCRLGLNADGRDGIAVDVADERFCIIDEFSGERSGSMCDGDGIDGRVVWVNDAGRLAGSTVRLRIRLTKVAEALPRLYAAYLSAS